MYYVILIELVTQFDSPLGIKSIIMKKKTEKCRKYHEKIKLVEFQQNKQIKSDGNVR